MANSNIRIGIIGAGNNTRTRHIPGFRAIPGVEIAGVVNSSPESTARVARELGIPKTYPDWNALVADPAIDAVCIGTWPNLHCEVTVAALSAGKHVLTEARMARNLAEAQVMLAAARARPELIAQIVPSPFALAYDRYVRHLMETEYFGPIREAVIIGADNMFWDYTKPLHWRQDAEISGLNTLALGIMHESARRWLPPVERLYAQTQSFEPTRPHPTRKGQLPVTVPDSVQVVARLKGGGRAIYHLSGVTLFGPGKQIHLYGRNGTLRYIDGPQEKLLVGRVGDADLREIDVPDEFRGGWRVEAEFIGAIRGEEPIRYNDFATGVEYMEFTEAVARSAASDLPVSLPLAD